MTGAALSLVRLANRRVLVVEDEYMVAQEMAEMLSVAGADTLGPVPGVAEAVEMLTTEGFRVDAALLDVNLRGETVWPLVDVLLARGVPVVLATGYDANAIPPGYASLPRCEKPTTTRDLALALERSLTG